MPAMPGLRDGRKQRACMASADDAACIRDETFLRRRDAHRVGERDAVFCCGDLRKNGYRDFGRRAAADVDADGSVEPRDLLLGEIELAQPLASLGVVAARPERAD